MSSRSRLRFSADVVLHNGAGPPFPPFSGCPASVKALGTCGRNCDAPHDMRKLEGLSMAISSYLPSAASRAGKAETRKAPISSIIQELLWLQQQRRRLNPHMLACIELSNQKSQNLPHVASISQRGAKSFPYLPMLHQGPRGTEKPAVSSVQSG